MTYERKEPLPLLEAKFENFYIRYDIDESGLVFKAEIWHVAEWAGDGKPMFWNAGSRMAECSDATKAESLFTLDIKWDGCSHLRLPYLHFDSLDEVAALVRCVTFIYDELCDEHLI